MSTSRNGILIAGTLVVDHIKIIDAWPGQDGLSTIRQESIACGGSPPNVLGVLSCLGAGMPLQAAGLVGNDADGDTLLKSFDEANIDRTRVGRCDLPTAYTDVMTSADSGRRTLFHHRGANVQFAPQHCQLSTSNSKIFCLAYLLLLDQMEVADPEYGCAAARVLAEAQSLGMRTVFDAVSEESDRFAQVITPVLPYSDYAIINEWEAGRILGEELRPDGTIAIDAVKIAAAELIKMGVRRAVIIHYPEGVVAADADGNTTTQSSLSLPEDYIVSSLGAGDAFVAGCLLVLHKDGNIADALHTGIAVAAASLHGASATASVQSLEQCLALHDTFPSQEKA